MKNSTSDDASGGVLSAGQIVTITLSGISLLGSLLTCVYIKMKSKVSEKQDSKIKITNEVTKEGAKTTTLNSIEIVYNNYGSYSEETVTVKNEKKEQTKVTSVPVVKGSNDSAAIPLLSREVAANSSREEAKTVSTVDSLVLTKPIAGSSRLSTLLDHNRQDELLIADTRKSLERDSFEVYLKTVSMACSGETYIEVPSASSGHDD